jgi:hypothetical protein
MDFRKNPELITNELYNFVISGSGILTGYPGAGKSYEIEKLVNFLEEKEYTVLFLPIDKLVSETDVDLQDELDLKTNLFEYISSEDSVSSSKKGVVIVDAFDAARSGQKKNFYIKLIRKIASKLNEEWNILVVVRIFDAKKSPELLEIFSNSHPEDKDPMLSILKISKEIPCRHAILPELNMDDISHVLSEHPVLSKYSSDFNPRLKKLLLNPFNISLILRLIHTEENPTKLNPVYSEVQLLDLFWSSRIESRQSEIKYELFLNELTNKMIITHSLSVPISYLSKSIEDGEDYLFSNGILVKVGINKNKIAYAHNILFDYAVSRLVIDNNENGLFKLISSDKSNIILLRPSIWYYLTKVWYNDKILFKKICLKLYKSNAKDIPIIAKIMTTRVVVQEAESINDFDFIVGLYEKNNEYRDWLHATIYSSLESFEKDLEYQYQPNRKFWLDYFEKIIQKSSNSRDFNVVGWLYKTQKEDKNADIQAQIGRISRKILTTCLELRKNDLNIDKFASHLPVVLVVNTYSTDPSQSRAILEKVLEITSENDFDLSYLFAVAYNIKELFRIDPEFVSKVYVLIFSRIEESKKQTEIGTAGFLRLTSNRRQDFEGIRYHLGQESKDFLESDLRIGLKTLIKSFNYGICRMHILPYLQEGHLIEERISKFSFNKKESRFLEDFCYIWGDSFFHQEPEHEILNQINNKLSELSEKNPDLLKIVLNEYADNAIVAILWRDLIKLATKHPESFSSIILDLICAKPLQLHSETVNELADLIETSARSFSKEEMDRIVRSIIQTFDEINKQDYKKSISKNRNYLLSKIPLNILSDEVVKADVEEFIRSDNTPPRKPVEISDAHIGFASEDDILQSLKINPEDSGNKLVLPSIWKIKKICDEINNNTKSNQDALSVFPIFKELYNYLEDRKNEIPQETIDFAWDELSRYVKIIAMEIKTTDSDFFEYSRRVLLISANLLKTHSREIFLPDYDPSSWSSTPVTNAAEGLLYLYSLQSDDKIWKTIRKLSKHQDPVVRMLITISLNLLVEKNPDKYWEMIDDFLENERNYKLHEYLCYSLSSAFRKNPESIGIIKTKFELIWRKSKKWDIEGIALINNNCFIASVSYFAFVDNTDWAKDFYDEVIQNPKIYTNIRARIVSLNINEFFAFPTILNNNYDAARVAVSGWLNSCLRSTFDEIKPLLSKPQITEADKKQIGDFYEVIEQYITRFFFVVDKKYNKINDSASQYQATGIVFKSESETFTFVLDSILELNEKFALRGDEIRYMMGILDSCWIQNPEKVLNLAVKTLKIGQRIGYSSDPFTIKEIQEFIDHLLADHGDILEGKKAMDDFTDLLDILATGNNPDAIKYIMSLDIEYH